MKSVSISGSLRTNVGKKDANTLRAQALVPCVLYGGKEQIHFSVPSLNFKPLVYTPDVHSVNLDLDGKKFNAIVQEIQYHKVKDHIIHVDFLEVVEGKPVTMSIPVKTTGAAPGVRAGGKLNKKLRTVKVRGLLKDIPDAITIDISKLEIGDGVRVSDLNAKGLTFLNAPNVTVVNVQVTRVVAEPLPGTAPAAGAAAPAAGAATPAAGAAAPAAGAAAKPAAPAKK